MKYLHLTLCSLLFASLFSCSKDGDSLKPSKTLTGKWQMTSFAYTGTTTITFGGESATTPFSGTGKDMDISISFADDPNTYTSMGDYTIALTMDVDGQKINQDIPVQGFMGSGTWNKDGNKLIVNDKATGTTQTATIMQLDDKTLKIQWGGALSPTNPYDIPMAVAVNGTYVFERK